MAIYYNLGIDCGKHEIVADRMVKHFDNFQIPLADHDAVECETWKLQQRNLWFVCVWPRGMGYATLPVHRDELILEVYIQAIQTALYTKLGSIQGFRRALFGAEIFDTFGYASPEEDETLDYPNLIYCKQTYPNPSQKIEIKPFSEGYQIVVRVLE